MSSDNRGRGHSSGRGGGRGSRGFSSGGYRGGRGGGRGRGRGSSGYPPKSAGDGSEMRTFVAIPLPKHVIEHISDYSTKLDQQFQTSQQQRNFIYRWVNPDKYHITLKFLGDQKQETMVDLHKELQRTLKEVKSFKLRIGHTSEKEVNKCKMLGVFPSTKNPRVVFVHAETLKKAEEKAAEGSSAASTTTTTQPDDTRSLYNKVMDAVHSASVPYDDKKDLAMHITVARVEEKNKGGYRGGRGGMSHAGASAYSVNYTELHAEWEATVNTHVELSTAVEFDVDRVVILQSVGGKYLELHEVKLQ